jgi:hypothetical protein
MRGSTRCDGHPADQADHRRRRGLEDPAFWQRGTRGRSARSGPLMSWRGRWRRRAAWRPTPSSTSRRRRWRLWSASYASPRDRSGLRRSIRAEGGSDQSRGVSPCAKGGPDDHSAPRRLDRTVGDLLPGPPAPVDWKRYWQRWRRWARSPAPRQLLNRPRDMGGPRDVWPTFRPASIPRRDFEEPG